MRTSLLVRRPRIRRVRSRLTLVPAVLVLAALAAVPAGALPPETSPVRCDVGVQGQRFGAELRVHAWTRCNAPFEGLDLGPVIATSNDGEIARRSRTCSVCSELELRAVFPCVGACFGDWRLSGRHFMSGALWLTNIAGTGLEISTVDTEPGYVNCGPSDGPNLTNVRRTLTVQCFSFTLGT